MAQMIHVLLSGMFLTYWSLFAFLFASSEDPKCGFHKEPKTWIGALRYCQENHTLLIHTHETKNHVNNCLTLEEKNNITNGAWIGLERSIFGCNVKWVWLSGETFSLPKDINNNDNSSHYCGKIRSHASELQILSGYCFDKLPFICYEP